jgi:hypothetical protein
LREKEKKLLRMGIRRGEWSALGLERALTAEKRFYWAHWIGGWVRPRAGLDSEAKIIALTGDRTTVGQSIVRHCTDSANPSDTGT